MKFSRFDNGGRASVITIAVIGLVFLVLDQFGIHADENFQASLTVVLTGIVALFVPNAETQAPVEPKSSTTRTLPD